MRMEGLGMGNTDNSEHSLDPAPETSYRLILNIPETVDSVHRQHLQTFRLVETRS